jgi:hypothetical protein
MQWVLAGPCAARSHCLAAAGTITCWQLGCTQPAIACRLRHAGQGTDPSAWPGRRGHMHSSSTHSAPGEVLGGRVMAHRPSASLPLPAGPVYALISPGLTRSCCTVARSFFRLRPNSARPAMSAASTTPPTTPAADWPSVRQSLAFSHWRACVATGRHLQRDPACLLSRHLSSLRH